MRFGSVPLAEAAGAVLAHSVAADKVVLKKGHRLVPEDIDRLAAAGLAEVVVARLDADDVPEDEAAARLAARLAGAEVEVGRVITGRANLYSRRAGLLRLDVARIDAINAVDESLTVATLPAWEVVGSGQMLATIKVIPYAAPAAALQAALARAAGASATLEIEPWRGLSVALVLTRGADTRAPVLAKMRVAVQGRLGPLGGHIACESTVAHTTGELAAAIRQAAQRADIDCVLVSGIAATVDPADVVPAAIRAAGGRVLRVGMPVDPGNLLVLGVIDRGPSRCPVVGIPTCARSPKLNGFDFVLRRIAAGLEVGATDIAAMGVGGLLTEIPSRPAPREER
jgi:molybdenum cofactor cytidylyltransferase